MIQSSRLVVLECFDVSCESAVPLPRAANSELPQEFVALVIPPSISNGIYELHAGVGVNGGGWIIVGGEDDGSHVAGWSVGGAQLMADGRDREVVLEFSLEATELNGRFVYWESTDGLVSGWAGVPAEVSSFEATSELTRSTARKLPEELCIETTPYNIAGEPGAAFGPDCVRLREATGGCSTGGPSPSGPGAVALGLLGVVVRRRRGRFAN